jgi:secreted trypsin-like serine protease
MILKLIAPFVAAAAIAASGQALALGGRSATVASGSYDNRVVMVLGTRGSVCSGTVIAPTIVITAAHCVTGPGQYAVAYKDGGSATLQEIRQLQRHPQYRQGSRVSIDIALIRLKLPLPSRFAAVPLDDKADDDAVGSSQTIAGFGLAREGDDASAGTLRSADVRVLPKFYPRYFRLGISGGGLMVCKGDSGGPVFSGTFSTTLTAVIYAKEGQTGGRQCGEVAQAVRIAPQRGWIDSVRARWGE